MDATRTGTRSLMVMLSAAVFLAVAASVPMVAAVPHLPSRAAQHHAATEQEEKRLRLFTWSCEDHGGSVIIDADWTGCALPGQQKAVTFHG